MLPAGPDAEQDTPRAVQASEDEKRFLEVAFCLSAPERMAVFRELMERETSLTCTELAGRLGFPKDETQEHLKELMTAGLVEEDRRGILRERVYRTGVSDVEIRFFGGKRTRQARKRTRREVSRDARQREKMNRKRARKEARIAKKRARMAREAGD